VKITFSAPVIIAVIPPPANNFLSGQAITLLVKFDEVVVVTGSPRYPITFDDGVHYLGYSHGSGTDTLTFSYNVQSGDFANNAIIGNQVDLNGGSITNMSGNSFPSNAEIRGLSPLQVVGAATNRSVPGSSPIIKKRR